MSDPVSRSTPPPAEASAEGPSSTARSGASGAGADYRSAEPRERAGLFDRLRGLIAGWRGSGSLRSDLAEVLASDSDVAADLTATERTMLRNILELRDLRVGDVMVPRADIVAVQKDISLGELLAVFANAGHSRLVVYDDTLDDPVGMVHIRDLVAHLTQKAMTPRAKAAAGDKASTGEKAPTGEGSPAAERSAGAAPDARPPSFNLKAIDLSAPLSSAKLIRRLLFVPPSMPSIELLASMQAGRIHLALVIDEYGGTDGIVSMEDLMEEIVGDIEDEHDDDETPMIVRQADGSFLADARAGLEEVADMVDPAFALGEEAEEVDTLGGLLVTLAGRVPVRGEIVAGPGNFEIEVLDADPRRVKRLRIVVARDGAARARRRERGGNEAPAARNSLPPPAEQSGGGPRAAANHDSDAA
ncbi:hemolysin family protein [Bosea sp. 117]|uniref:hemolysin family protein n=1 Tax=Bosea sp. 117 TaxID=1125973 RepID=UPI000494690E|nr:hemolysin family protein [Bosea sp. 117]